ncbi:MAG: OmpH family outer membrane protein [Chrysiogenetes bacterium]|nr:OmpH family outer membrane protein [Chrysiogenetes bacterium]
MRTANRFFPLFLLVLAALSFTAPTMARAAEGSKVAIVDLRRILLESEKGKKANAEMQAEFEKRKKALEKQQEQAMALQKELTEQELLLSAEMRERKSEELRRIAKDVQRRMSDYEEEIKRLDQKLTEKILSEVSDIIEAHAKKNKIDVIFDTTTAKPIYFDPSIDITDMVLKAYDKS